MKRIKAASSSKRTMDGEEDSETLRCAFCRGKNSYCSSSQTSYVSPKSTRRIENEELIKCEENDGEEFAFDLPESIILQIFCFLNHRDLLSVRCVSTSYRRIAEDRYLWRYLNLSCKRVFEENFIFRLPVEIRELVKTVNLMWAHVSIPSFNSMKILFPNLEILLMQYCKFSLQFKEVYGGVPTPNPLPNGLKILDLRNVHGRWFDDANANTTWPCMEAIAFSQSMPKDWMSRLANVDLPQLRILCIDNNPGLNDAFMSAIVQRSPQLQSISIHGCMYITGTFLTQLPTHATNVETLDLSGTRLEGRPLLSTNWSRLKIKSLNISFCCKVFEQDLVHFLPQLKHLQQFRGSFAGWGRALSDEVLCKMTTAMGELMLETIDVQSTFNLSVRSLAKLCSHAPLLKHLRIGTILKTSDELSVLLNSIPNIRSLSLQLGDAEFSAAYLFNGLASHCRDLEALFNYNASFECSRDELRSSLVRLFTSCTQLSNFFTGGFAHHVRVKVDEIIKCVTDELGVCINTLKPTRIIPLPRVSFDRHLCDVLTKSRITKSLKLSIQRTLNSQSFYKTGLQKLDEYHFSLLRT